MSFNLNEEGGLADFIEEFKVFRAIGVIRKELNKVSNNSKSTNNSGNINEMDQMVRNRLVVCGLIISRLMMKPDEMIDQKIVYDKMVTDQEWNIIRDGDADNLRLNQLKNQKPDNQEQKINQSKKDNCKYPGTTGTIKQSNQNRNQNKKNKCDEQKEMENMDDEKLLEYLKEKMKMLEDNEQLIQYKHLINHSNIWILKPISLSRGRGIKMVKQLSEVLDHIERLES